MGVDGNFPNVLNIVKLNEFLESCGIFSRGFPKFYRVKRKFLRSMNMGRREGGCTLKI